MGWHSRNDFNREYLAIGVSNEGSQEAFLTSTTRNVHPISAVDGVPLPACPGPVTSAARRAFANLMAETLDP